MLVTVPPDKERIVRKVDLRKDEFYLVKDGERDLLEGYLVSLNPDDYFQAKAEVGIRQRWSDSGHNKVVMAVRPFTVKDGEVTWGTLYGGPARTWTVKLVSLGHITEPLHHANYEALVHDAHVRAEAAKAEREAKREAEFQRLDALVFKANTVLGDEYLMVGPVSPGSLSLGIKLVEARYENAGKGKGYRQVGRTVTMEELAEAIIELGEQ